MLEDLIESLITDRTSADVKRAVYLNTLWDARAQKWRGTAEEFAEWKSGPRGAYGAADLNRVMQAVSFLAGRLERYGYRIAPDGKPVLPAYTVRLLHEPQNGGSVSGGGVFYKGDLVTVQANPSEKYDFSMWTESGEMVSENRIYSFSAEAPRNLKALFSLKTFFINVSIDPPGSGEVAGSGRYTIDTLATLHAVANDDFAFTAWTENGITVSESAEYQFTAERDRNLVAVLTEIFTISVGLNNEDGGSVAGAGRYLNGAPVTVSVTVGEGFVFTGWMENGTVVSVEETYTFIASQSRNLIAELAKLYTITGLISPDGSGSVQGGGVYREGASVTLSALPNEDYRFLAWMEDGEQVSEDAVYTFTASSDRVLTALFEEIPIYLISVIADPEGGGAVSGGGRYREGASVTLTRTLNEGYRFLGWYDASDGTLLGEDESYTFTAEKELAIAAKYEIIPVYHIVVLVFPEAAGTVAGDGFYLEGSTVTLTRTIHSGYRFLGWYDAENTLISSAETCTFTAERDATITAKYEKIPVYSITLSVDPEQNGWGTVSGAGTYQQGQTVTVTATPEDGYEFAAWKENGTAVSTNASYTFTATKNTELLAFFKVQSRLPSGYTELTYIQSGNGQYINTGIVPPYVVAAGQKIDTKVVLDVEPLNAASDYEYYFGCRNTYRGGSNNRIYNSYYMIWRGTSASYALANAGLGSMNGTTINNKNTTQRIIVTVDGPNAKASIDGVSVTTGSLQAYMPPITLLAVNHDSYGTVSANMPMAARIFSCQIYKAGVLVRDFVPCKDSTGAAGLYDLVNALFYKSASASNFLAGPEI